MINTGELTKAYERLYVARTSLLLMQESQKTCRELADHVLALTNHDRLWPKGFTGHTFTELQTELGLMDAAAGLVEKELKNLERACAEATSILNEAVVLERRNQTPVMVNGMTMEQHFDAHIVNAEVYGENVVDVFRVFDDHARTIRGMLGL